MKTPNRREFLTTAALAASAALVNYPPSQAGEATPRRMRMSLSCGAIGVSADQREATRLAAKHGFEAVDASAEFLSSLAEAELSALTAEMKLHQLVFGIAGLPIEFRRQDAQFNEGMKHLPALAAGLKRAGADRWGTWLSPCDNTRTYLENFKLHAKRLKEVALVLRDQGQRLGLEYVGTKTAREHCRYPFIHCLAEMKELIAEIDTGNVGLILDSWHWWQADDTVADLKTLTNADIVSVDLNDAPAGIPKDKQLDGKRELPAATGVIDGTAFLKALLEVGYDGPVRAEPFNKVLNDLGNEEACAATAVAMKKAFALLDR